MSSQQAEKNTCFYMHSPEEPGKATVVLRGASGRWCRVLTLEPGEFNPAIVLTEEQGREYFAANSYEGDWLEI